MPFLLVLVGAILLVSAINNTQGTLATELETDVPPFMKWALAIVAVGALGWIPGMKPISRWLLALVLVVIVLNNYRQAIAGFQNLGQAGALTGSAASSTPAQAYVANPNQPSITTAEITGGANTTGNINAANIAAAIPASQFGAFDPAAFLTAFESGVGGFGGVA